MMLRVYVCDSYNIDAIFTIYMYHTTRTESPDTFLNTLRGRRARGGGVLYLQINVYLKKSSYHFNGTRINRLRYSKTIMRLYLRYKYSDVTRNLHGKRARRRRNVSISVSVREALIRFRDSALVRRESKMADTDLNQIWARANLHRTFLRAHVEIYRYT